MDRNEFEYSLYYTTFLTLNGKVYVHKMMPPEIWLVYEDGAWEKTECPEGETEHLLIDRAYEMFCDNPPHPVLDKIEKSFFEKEHKELVRRIETTARRVIGWAYRPYGRLKENQDAAPDEYAAVVKDVKERGYLYSGEQYQDENLEPVLDDYRFVSFSRRGFGGVMADAYGKKGAFAYALFMERDRVKAKKTPQGGLYPEYPGANGMLSMPKGFREQVEPYLDKNVEEGVIVYATAIAMPKDGYYFPDQRVEVLEGESDYIGSFPIYGVFVMDSAEEMEQKLAEDQEQYPENRYLASDQNIPEGESFLLIYLRIAGED